MEKELTGKVVVVTGAGRMRSIGRPIAVLLARAGANVVLTGTGRTPDRYPDDEKAAGWRDIESVADEVRAEGAKCLALVSDIRSEDANRELVERTVAEFEQSFGDQDGLLRAIDHALATDEIESDQAERLRRL